ncbi:sensor histidine kinase (plasmid) [Cereibacter azotoformans]|uniref:sensor histidine kinase n=1 Tax=Cereibacter azotoformans TaxID=43057 RepID=UPI003B214773
MIFALPCVSAPSGGNYEFFQGYLFELPPELSSNYQLQKYADVSVPGWSRCELGYWVYAATDGDGVFVVPGLYLTDSDKPRKKIYGYGPTFSKKQVERYAQAFIESKLESRREAEKELTSLVHDLRHLSHSIYHSALEAEAACRLNQGHQIAEKIKSIIASQAMLKVRIDYLDYANSVDRFSELEDIPVYSRVDKVKRCFESNAKSKNIDLHLSGTSFRLATGPNILDIVTYTFVENAIKYSPKDKHVDISVKDTENSTCVSVSSFGPVIEKEEFQEVFKRGGRGKNARNLRPSGTGLGLSVAKEIIDVFAGSIAVTPQGEIFMHDNVPFQRVTFSFVVPTAGEDEKRKMRIERVRSRRKRSLLPL